MKSITFVGRASGDMECFCWDDVPEEDMIVVLGKEQYEHNLKLERDWREDWNLNEMSTPKKDIPEKLSRLYPNDVLRAIGAMDKNKKFKITVTAEEVE
jgi:hypothetical protein